MAELTLLAVVENLDRVQAFVDAELEKPCFSRPGDIWKLGRHTVICGDSTDPETFGRLLGDTKVNLVCTDAPYFVNLKNSSGTIANDNLEDTQAYEFLMKAFANFKNAMAADASIYEFYATMKARVFYDAFEDAASVSMRSTLAFGKISPISCSAFWVPVPPKRSDLL